MTSDYYVYTISDLDGAVRYVGAGCKDRWIRHDKQGDNAQLKALNAAGLALPAIKVRDGLTQAEAFARERALIAFHGRADLGLGPLLNLTDGGPGMPNPSAETRENLAAAQRGKPKSPNAIAKTAAAKLGKTRSAETRAKIAESLRGRKNGPMSTEAIAKSAAARRGQKRTAESRARMSEAHCGKPWSAARRAAQGGSPCTH